MTQVLRQDLRFCRRSYSIRAICLSNYRKNITTIAESVTYMSVKFFGVGIEKNASLFALFEPFD